MVTIPDYITLDSVNGEKEVVKITGPLQKIKT